jgi:hypothetical protein
LRRGASDRVCVVGSIVEIISNALLFKRS